MDKWEGDVRKAVFDLNQAVNEVIGIDVHAEKIAALTNAIDELVRVRIETAADRVAANGNGDA